jgi:protein-disulfide isomerase
MTDQSPQTPPSADTFSISRELINTIIVGIVFIVAGIFIGLTISGGNITAREVRSIVNDELETAIRNNLSDTLIAAVGTTSEQLRLIVREELGNSDLASASGEQSIDPAMIESIVTGALNQLERDRNYMMGDGPYIGPEDAPVVIVEFSDFRCGFCGRHFDQTLTPLLDNFDGYIRYIYRDFPVVGGENAVRAALAAECANDQGKFWEYHNLLFSNQANTGGTDMDALSALLVTFAEDLELEMDQFNTCYETQQHYTNIIRDSNDAQAIGARGTPAFVINGKFLSGAQPYEVFEDAIIQELNRQGIPYEPKTSS